MMLIVNWIQRKCYDGEIIDNHMLTIICWLNLSNVLMMMAMVLILMRIRMIEIPRSNTNYMMEIRVKASKGGHKIVADFS